MISVEVLDSSTGAVTFDVDQSHRDAHVTMKFSLVRGREQQMGGSGGSLEPLGLFLNPLDLFLRTSIPFIQCILSAFLRA